MKDPDLWNRIATVDFGDDLHAGVRATTGWPEDRIAGAIAEYRRFLYLSGLVTRTKRIPGKAVDVVWQAHRADRDAYRHFCHDILGRELKHDRSGTGQQAEATRKAYAREFGEAPPELFWPDPNRITIRVMAAVFAAAGLLGAVFGGSLWPGLVGLGLGAFLIWMPRHTGPGSDDAALMGVFGAGGLETGGYDSGGGDTGGSD